MKSGSSLPLSALVGVVLVGGAWFALRTPDPPRLDLLADPAPETDVELESGATEMTAPSDDPRDEPPEREAATDLAPGPVQGEVHEDRAAIQDTRPDDGRGTPYIFNRSDSICGVTNPMAISRPARVDYPSLVELTQEVRKIRRELIDPQSTKGLALMKAARSHVLKACQEVQKSKGHCSVWMKIERRDKRPVPDITAEVEALLTKKR